jgi:hypothetical protein
MNHERFQAAIRRFDEINSQDPNQVPVDGNARPKELIYGEQMTAWLDRFAPEASEALKLAARAQHIQRWSIPRSQYPEGRQGYKQWRSDLAKFHADTAAAVLAQVGYDEPTISRVRSLLRKEKLKVDPEAQTLEDVACLVFLENYFADFAQRYQGDDDKIVDIVRKTWIKMSDRGHAAALQLPLSEEAKRIVGKALG